MSRAEKERVLSRWSRLKLESARASEPLEKLPEPVAANSDEPVEKSSDTESPEGARKPGAPLPLLDELDPSSDFSVFMEQDVDDNLRRAALKKLFLSADFNVTDGLDVYAEDYTNLETMTPAMVAGLKHAHRLLFDDADKNANEAHQAHMLEDRTDDHNPLTPLDEVRDANAGDADASNHPGGSDGENNGETEGGETRD